MSSRREAGRCLDRDATFATAAPSFDPLSSFAESLNMQHAFSLGVSSVTLLCADVSDEIFFGRAVVPLGDLVHCHQITNSDSRGSPSTACLFAINSNPLRKSSLLLYLYALSANLPGRCHTQFCIFEAPTVSYSIKPR